MTTLYHPVLIESAEQAEALPVGTVAFEAGDQGQAIGASVRVRGGWHCTGYCLDFGGAEVLNHSDMIGDTALVPIETKKERTWISSNLAGPMHVGFGAAFDTPHTRLVTPWEEA